MKPLNVEFRQRGVPGKWAWSAAALLLSAGVFMLAFDLWQQRELARMRSTLEGLSQPQKQPETGSRTSDQASPSYARSASELLLQAHSPWPQVLVALESVSIPGISITALEISATEHEARLDLEFASYETLLRYITRLNAESPSVAWQLRSTDTADSVSNAVASQKFSAHLTGAITNN
jgi:hypothetical protein